MLMLKSIFAISVVTGENNVCNSCTSVRHLSVVTQKRKKSYQTLNIK